MSHIGSVYTFLYEGTDVHDYAPEILLCTRNGSVSFILGTGVQYIGGINLNYLSPDLRSAIVEKYGPKFPVDYKTVISDFDVGHAYRLYYLSKVRSFTLVDPSIYLGTL